MSNIIIAPAIHFKVNGQRERWTAARLVAGYKLILDWPISIHLKFLLTCAAVTGILLVIYQLGVWLHPHRDNAERQARPRGVRMKLDQDMQSINSWVLRGRISRVAIDACLRRKMPISMATTTWAWAGIAQSTPVAGKLTMGLFSATVTRGVEK